MTRTVAFALSALTLASPATAQVDPVARDLARQALTAATAPTAMKIPIVGSERPGTPAVANSSGTIGDAPIQVNGSAPNDTGYLAFKYGADGKGVTNYWVKTRSPAMNGYAAVQNGDRIVVDLWQAGTGAQTGHVGGTRVTVDNAAFSAGEVAGRWALFTGTGIASSQVTQAYPRRYGSMNAIVANSYQQILFPGGVNPALASAGSNFGGWVVIGAGAASPGFAPLKFLRVGAALLATPEAGAFEVDANARPYFTAADGVRRSIMLADTAAPTVKVLPDAGSGATATITATGTAGIVQLVTSAATRAGDLFTVTYAHAYPSASYPVIAAANAAAVALVRNGYLTATASGFTVSQPATPGTALPAGTYAITFNAPGA